MSTILVTGATDGLGRAVAGELASRGHDVLVHGRDRDRVEAVAGEIGAAGTHVADFAELAQVRAMAAALDGIDVLVNNAGLGGTANVVDMTDEQWDAVIGVTLTGTFRCTRAALRHMQERGSGVIVNNASVVGWRAQEGQGHYAAAKAGVMALTRCSAVEAAHFGVRINAVAPSLAMHANLAKVTTDELLATLTAQEAFGRAAEPWEVANVIVFLASDYSSYLTGEVISVSSQHP